MAGKSRLPEVAVDTGRVEDFVQGIYGKNRAANKRAYARAAVIGGAVVAYNLAKKKRGR